MIKKVFFVAALSCGSVAFAQVHKMEHRDSTVTERTYNLNPVVVTGSGHHQRLKSTATPVRVLSAQEIHEQGISTFDGALTRMMPQVSMAPNSMGTFLRLNGLGNKYILILINGQKLTGDISNNVDLNRINMARVKRIEVLDGAASSLYGSDAIAGVINIITDQPTQNLVSVTSDTRISGKGQLTEAVTLDIFTHGFGSYTSFTHDRADSYQNNGLEYVKGSDTETQPTIAPLYTGYRSNLVGQKFTYAPNDKLAFNAGLDYTYKITDRPDTRADITGGTDYEMQYKGFRWNAGGIYKFTSKNSLQATFTASSLPRTRCKPRSLLTDSAMERNTMWRPRATRWVISFSPKSNMTTKPTSNPFSDWSGKVRPSWERIGAGTNSKPLPAALTKEYIPSPFTDSMSRSSCNI